MDVVDYYLREESDHVSFLIAFLKNESKQSDAVLFSNLFNFRADFIKGTVIIEDDCGLFCTSDADRKSEFACSELLKRVTLKN